MKVITYFISGHRDLSREDFNKYYIPAINNAIYDSDDSCDFVVGDCEGADIMAQEYLLHIEAKFTVYHIGKEPQNFVLKGSTKKEIAARNVSLKGGFADDISRDEAMTKWSDVDIAFIGKGRWTSGTAQNILRRHERSI